MSAPGLFSRLDTVIIRVRDIEQAAAWYRQKLGLSSIHEDRDERLAVLQVDAASSLTLWQLKPGEQPAGRERAGTYPIFGVEDAERVRRELMDRGVEVDPLQEGAGVRYFRFRDPDGNALEACQLPA